MSATTPARAGRTDAGVVAAVAVAGAVLAASSGASPVGRAVPDVVWTAGAGLLVTLASSRATKLPLLWLAAVAAVVGAGGDATAALLGLGGLTAALWTVIVPRPRPPVSAAIGALAIGALLRGPSYGPLLLPTLVALAAVVPVLVAGYLGAGSTARRVSRWTAGTLAGLVILASVGALAATAAVAGDAGDATDAATAALQDLRNDDLEGAAAGFTDAAGRFGQVHDGVAAPWALPGRLVPVLGQQLTAVDRVSTSARTLSEEARTTAESADYEGLRTQDGAVDVAELEAMVAPVSRSAAATDDALATVQDVRSPWLVDALDTRLDRLQSELDDMAPTVHRAVDVLAVAPRMLGADGPRRYLLALATPAELRPGGGFVGSFAVLTIDRGRFGISSAQSTDRVADELLSSGSETDFDPPAGWDERYGSYDVQLFPGNITASPDWPTDTGVALQIYPQLPGVGPLDGALYLDPEALASILDVTGPIQVEGEGLELGSDDIEAFLLRDQYQLYPDTDERRDVLDAVVQGVFDAFTARSLPGAGEVFDALGPAVEGGHLRFSVTDTDAEQLLDEVGLSGRWTTRPGADYLSLRSYDLRSNKLDAYLERDVEVDVAKDRSTGEQRSEVTVVLTNTAPPSGLPTYVAGVDFGASAPGSIRDGLSLFTPGTLLRVTIDDVEVGVERTTEFGGNVFTVAVEIPPGGVRTVRYELRDHQNEGEPYRLDVLPQALATPDDLVVRVAPLGAPTQAATVWDGPVVGVLELDAIDRS